nr:hypothetical protein [Ningiella sp. W23]
MLSLFEEQVSKSWDNLPRTLIYHEVLEIFEIIYTLENSQDEMIIESITKDNVDEFSGKNKKAEILNLNYLLHQNIYELVTM